MSESNTILNVPWDGFEDEDRVKLARALHLDDSPMDVHMDSGEVITDLFVEEIVWNGMDIEALIGRNSSRHTIPWLSIASLRWNHHV